MAERYGADFIYSILSNDSTVTALVPAADITEGPLVPQNNRTQETINYYRTGPYSGRAEWFETRWSADCRSKTYKNSRDISTAVLDALNRVNATVNGNRYYAVAEILPTLQPVDRQDVYNTPVEIYLRRA